MQPAHEARLRRRSPFVAAFLSLLFPGLGHAYLGMGRRALGLAAPPILFGALSAGVAVRLDLFELAGLAIQAWFLWFVFVANLALLAYRAVAIVDAWRVASLLDASARAGVAEPLRLRPAPLALAGLAAVLLVMSGVHIVVARYDLLLARTADCIFEPARSGCPGAPEPSADPSALPGPGPSASPAPTAPPLGTPVGAETLPPWDGVEPLNVLLIGADKQGGGHNTDTLIVMSVDPATRRIAMFSLPRDTVDVPLPAGPVRAVFGRAYAGKINSFFVNVRHRADLFPGTDETRGYNGLKAALGELYELDIRYFVEVDFDGFRSIVDALGGVTVNVQLPVVDDGYPAERGRLRRIYIASGMQHMTGAEALVYARSRHGSSDFDRAQRQQRLLLSIRQQTDIARILPRVDELATALAASIRTDIPRDLIPRLLGLADWIDTRTLRSYVFAPPLYGSERIDSRGYVVIPNVDRIQATVRDALAGDPELESKREALAAEGASVWVLNGSGVAGQASRIAGYLDSLAIAASAPNQKPDISGRTDTTILVTNGAEGRLPITVATLEAIFGVTAELVEDPTARVDIVIVTGKRTPDLTPPPAP